MKKVSVTLSYLETVLGLLQDCKGWLDVQGIKNDYAKHIRKTLKLINSVKEYSDV